MRGAKDNPELAEVRAILLKVQRLGMEPEEEDPAVAGPAPAGTGRQGSSRAPGQYRRI